MDEISVVSNSYDLSEASSVASSDSQDTDHTDVHSNVTKPYTNSLEDSPTDVRSYPDSYNSGINVPRLGGPLPIVREGAVFREEESEEEEEEGDVYAQYEREEKEFTREMNTTKIAFSAYRSAVLHLVHHQGSTKKNTKDNATDETGEELEEGGTADKNESFVEYGAANQNGSSEREKSEDEANHRMTLLEQNAKRMVETKAKACFEAVQVANDFLDKREERKTVTTNLFKELLNTSRNSDCDLAEEIAESLDGEIEPVAEPVAEPELVPEPAVTIRKVVPAKKEATPRTPKQPRQPTKKLKVEYKPQTFVRRIKPSKHAACIIATLPKFKYREESSTRTEENDEPLPASYRTTVWIGNMIKWRTQRNTYKVESLKKCGCPDCLQLLKGLAVQS